MYLANCECACVGFVGIHREQPISASTATSNVEYLSVFSSAWFLFVCAYFTRSVCVCVFASVSVIQAQCVCFRCVFEHADSRSDTEKWATLNAKAAPHVHLVLNMHLMDKKVSLVKSSPPLYVLFYNSISFRNVCVCVCAVLSVLKIDLLNLQSPAPPLSPNLIHFAAVRRSSYHKYSRVEATNAGPGRGWCATFAPIWKWWSGFSTSEQLFYT